MERVTERVLILIAATGVTVLALLCLFRTFPISAISGPDVIVQSIIVDPLIPDPGQPFTLTILTKNQGDVATGNFWNHIYLDPADDPPNQTTPHTYRYNNFPMDPGGTFLYTRDPFSFSTSGCDHVIYVWADKTDLVPEPIETNNILSETVCVGVTCEPDIHEDDDVCTSARWLTNTVAIPQHHTLCPVGDQDWTKFTAVGGMTYTIAATDLGAHADPLLYLYNTCDGPPQFGTGPSIEWLAPASGVYYVQVEHRQPAYGPLTSYGLVISTTGGLGDIYEPDDDCNMARDIPTDGSRQTRLFHTAGDQDWVKFTVDSGESFAIVADNVGVGVNPLISLYSSCGQTLGDYVNQSGQIQATTPTGRTYYAKVVNEDPSTYGREAHYDLSVTTVACTVDAFEEDDNVTAARVISTTGETETHNICPRDDQDWVRFFAKADTIYVLQTSNLGSAADTHLHLYDTDGTTELAHNDDYGYTPGSRIVWQATADGTYYAKVHHHNPGASGADTHFDLSIATGYCMPDTHEPDNGPFDAIPLVTDGQPYAHNSCADPLSSDISDQDWVRFEAVGSSPYLIQTANLGSNCDTVLHLYDRDRTTLLAHNDDYGSGRASAISITVPLAGSYYVQITHYNSSISGGETDYELSIIGEIPPTPTPTPTPTPAPTPPPTPTPQPSQVETLILVNRQRVAKLYGAADAAALMGKLYALADHDSVQGIVVQVESHAAVAAAYDAWTADLLNTDKANAVASAVRSLVMTFLNNNSNVQYIVIAGDDRVIPFRRVPEGNLSKTEQEYAASVTTNTTQWAACQDNMILTDDYYADKQPTTWQDADDVLHELYVPDYAIGRLIEEPNEVSAFIDAFLADDITEVNNVLVTGYEFVQDSSSIVGVLFKNDNLTTDDVLIGYLWSGASLREKQLNTSPRFDVQSINGHADHTTEKAPDHDDITASEIAATSLDLAGALVFSVGCHSGLNDSGSLDLPQAFALKGVNYVGNTGFGWGGGGIVYSEALMRNYAVELLLGTSTQIGKALTAAKQHYYNQALSVGPYDAKILMQSTLYGLPMYQITSGGTLDPDDPFPSADISSTAPSAFGDVSVGRLDYGLAGAFGENATEDGMFLTLDDWSHFHAGEPIQPHFFADISAPAAGPLHGVVLLSGVYSDTPAFDPVIALAYNEYVTSTNEPAFDAASWYPAVPFQIRSNASVSITEETMVTLLGQYHSDASQERLYNQLSFGTYYSTSPDAEPPIIAHIDGVLNETTGIGHIKVEATDTSGVIRVLVAHTDGQGEWHSQDLTYDDSMRKWTGAISGTTQTRYFVQIVDGAGNVAIDDNKGQYRALSRPLPLIPGSEKRLFLPLIMKNG